MANLIFRKYDENSISDQEFIKEVYKDEEHKKYFGKEVIELIHTSNSKVYNNLYIFTNNNNENIGYVEISDCISRGDINTVTLYYSVLPKFRGNKYGTMMLEIITKYIFETTEVNNIVMNVDPSNTFSINAVSMVGYSDFIDYDDKIQFFRRK